MRSMSIAHVGFASPYPRANCIVSAVAAADAGEAALQIAALQKGRHAALDDRPPEAVLGLIPLVVDLLERREMLVEQLP
jgi:hypothetical protein